MQYLERKGFSTDKNLDVTSSDEFNLKKIKVGRIDLFPIDRIGGAHVMKQKGYDSGNFQEALYLKDLSSGLYMAFSKKTSDMIVDKCKKVLNELKKDGTFDRIQDKYLK
jgi:polar amino acid transport system substrate-binding protein